MTMSYHESQLASMVQSRQQLVLTILAGALVASTVVTWLLVSAIRESNDLQRQLLVTQQAQPAAKPAVKRRAGAAAAARAQSEPRRAATNPWVRERRSVERTQGEGAPATQLGGGQQHLARYGRQ